MPAPSFNSRVNLDPSELDAAIAEKDGIVIPDEENVADYWQVRHQLDELKKDVRDVITHPNYSEPFLNAGRLVHIQHNDFDFGWGIILKYTKRSPTDKARGVPILILICN